jgi:hypothetical protein
VKYLHHGLKGERIKIMGGEDGLIGYECDLVGSGNRTETVTAVPADLKESWLKTTQLNAFREVGAAILIDPVPTQGTENISSGAATNLKVKIKSFEFEFINNLYMHYGFGSTALVDVDPQRRAATLKLSLYFANQTELDQFLNQSVLAFEFDAAGSLISPTGTMKYGMHLIIPKAQIKTAPNPKGGAGDPLSMDVECLVINDGVNAIAILDTFNSKTGYLA